MGWVPVLENLAWKVKNEPPGRLGFLRSAGNGPKTNRVSWVA